jgi:hypothetical protein
MLELSHSPSVSYMYKSLNVIGVIQLIDKNRSITPTDWDIFLRCTVIPRIDPDDEDRQVSKTLVFSFDMADDPRGY